MLDWELFIGDGERWSDDDEESTGQREPVQLRGDKQGPDRIG